MTSPNINALMTATRASHANALNLTETGIDLALGGGIDPLRLSAQIRRTHNTEQVALAATVLLFAGFLARAAVSLADTTGQTPDDIVDQWWEQAARHADLAEARLNGGAL